MWHLCAYNDKLPRLNPDLSMHHNISRMTNWKQLNWQLTAQILCKCSYSMIKRGWFNEWMCEHCTAQLHYRCHAGSHGLLYWVWQAVSASWALGLAEEQWPPLTFSALSITLLLSSSRVSVLHPIAAMKQSAERVPHI